jgi:high affinity Mn2+ porin
VKSVRRAGAFCVLAVSFALGHSPWATAQSVGPTPVHANPSAAPASDAPDGAAAEPPAAPEAWAIHGQSTFTEQYHPAFRSPYTGPQSLNPGSRGDETFDLTIYGGLRLWRGAEVWINPEVEQGFGLSNTFGVAGFPSAESYKLGAADPYVRLQRLFLRQTIDLGGETQTIDPDLNQLGGSQTANRLVFTVGKFSAVDIFDTNKYAHDARNDFLNWSVIDAGSFDYAGDAWGYTYGATAEWYQDWWTVRLGLTDMPTTPAYKYLDPHLFSQVQYLAEFEERHTLWDMPGAVRVTGFLTRGKLGSFSDALALAASTGTIPSTDAVLRYRSRAGIDINVEQQITDDLGAFLRAGIADGNSQIDAFTDIDQSVSFGLSLAGKQWNRPDDTVGLAQVFNNISRHEKNYLNAGGLGILIGDGILPRSGMEKITEAYYSAAVLKYTHLTFDYQFIDNPAYSVSRGPVSVLGARLHVQF